MTLPSNDEAFDIKGKILRKKNISPEYLKLAIQEDGKEKSTTVYIPRKDESVSCTPSNINFFYRDAIIHVQGCVNSESYYHVTQCSLIKCATNIKMIKEILTLSNHLTLASTMSMSPAYADSAAAILRMGMCCKWRILSYPITLW